MIDSLAISSVEMVVKSEKSVGMRWRVDFTTRSKHSWQNPPPLSNPIGYCEDFERVPDLEQEDNNAHLIVKRSWDIALVPLKQVLSDPDLPDPDLLGPRFTEPRFTGPRFTGTPIYRTIPFPPSIPVNRGPVSVPVAAVTMNCDLSL